MLIPNAGHAVQIRCGRGLQAFCGGADAYHQRTPSLDLGRAEDG